MKRCNRTLNNNIFGEDVMAKIKRRNRSDGDEGEGKKKRIDDWLRGCDEIEMRGCNRGF